MAVDDKKGSELVAATELAADDVLLVVDVSAAGPVDRDNFPGRGPGGTTKKAAIPLLASVLPFDPEGTAATAVGAHEAASDPHPQYTTAAEAGAAAAAAVAGHVAASDPHPQYAQESALATVATSGAYSDLSGRPTLGTASALASDTDGTLAANSDARIPTQKAVRTFVENMVSGLLDLKGDTNASANPNYPAASKGDAYCITAAGRMGGAAGKQVDIGDVVVAKADNAGGTEASVGASWFVLEHNLVGALLAANNLSDLANAATARTNLGLGSAATTNSTAYAPASHTHPASEISDSTTAGRALLTAVDAAAQRVALALSTIARSVYVSAPADGTIVVEAKAAFALTINQLRGLKTSSGSLTLKVQIGGVDVTGLTGLSVTTTAQDATASAANAVAAGDRVTVVISSSSSPAGLEFTLSATR